MKVKESATIQLIVPKVMTIFEDESQQAIRNKTSETLANKGKPTVPGLVAGLKSPNTMVRRGAASTLSLMGRDALVARDALQVAFALEPDPVTKEEMKKAILRISTGS